MAGLSLFLPLLQLIYYFSKLCGFRHFYYHAQEKTFKLLTYKENRFERFFLNLISFINLAATPAYIWQRLRIEYKNEENESIQPGAFPPPNFKRAITDSVYAVAYCLNFIVFKLNQQQFVVLGNELLDIHRSLQKRKTQLRVSNMLLLLSYSMPIIITLTIALNIKNYCSTVQICRSAATMLVVSEVSEVSEEFEILKDGKLLMLAAFIGWNNLFYVLHLQLLFMFYVLLSCYCRQLSDLLLKTSNKSVKRLEKLMKILPLLQTVQQRASRYFSCFLLLRISEMLHSVYCLVNAFKYDDESLHPLFRDLEDLELDKKMYNWTVDQRSHDVSVKAMRFVIQAIALLLELHALSVCKREHKNIMDVITFPMDTHSNRTELNADQNYELETMPNTIIVCNDVEPQINLFELMLDTQKELNSLSLDDTLGINIYNFKVPLKFLKNCVNQICCSTFVMICFHKSQEIMLKKYEQKYK